MTLYVYAMNPHFSAHFFHNFGQCLFVFIFGVKKLSPLLWVNRRKKIPWKAGGNSFTKGWKFRWRFIEHLNFAEWYMGQESFYLGCIFKTWKKYSGI